MDNFNGARGPEKKETVTVVEVKKRGIGLIAAIAVIAVIAGAVATYSYIKNKELQTKLDRQEKLMAEVEAHNQGLLQEKTTLEGKVAELLRLQEAEPVITSMQVEEQLAAIRELVTQKYIYTNADKWTDEMTFPNGWSVPFSESRFIVQYDGTIKAGIDLNSVKIDVDEENRKVIITLPASRITDHNVPQDSIEIFGVKDGLFNPVDINEPNALITEGKKTMEAKAMDRGLLTDADKEAEDIIRAFLSLIPGMGDVYTLEIRHG